ncbi:hypothetical protein [Luteimonas saliphila]|uniref:hypothetical protein n=1 Tax=Luteimonas saliphila TaxID=2804919 RepID=UPI00192D51CA|nr:hypothetical protein [Luteimonas saliphila]
MTRSLLLAALLLALPAAHAQDWNDDADPTQSAQAAAHQAYTARLADELARGGGARELALAALLRTAADAPQARAPDGEAPSRAAPRNPQIDAWLRDAAAKAGDDQIALQLVVAAMPAGSQPRREAARRWQAADSGNLMPLLYAGVTGDALLAAARTATRADARVYEGVRWIASAYRRHPPTAVEQSALGAGEAFDTDEAAAVSAMVLWAAVAMPAYGPLAEACGPDMLRAIPARRDDCRHVATLLAQTPSSIADERAGLGMLRSLATTPAERADVDARQRRMDWRMLEWGRIAQQQPRSGAAQFARLLADPSIGGEQQLVDRVLQEAGVKADPPPGWQPPRR